MPSLKLNELFQRRNTRDDQHASFGKSSHGRKSSLTLSAFNFSLTIEKDDKNPSVSSRPQSTVETAQHGPVWWQHRKSVVESAQSDEEMDQLLKARKMGSAAARRKKALEREAATGSMDDIVERTRRELRGGYRSEEEELSDSEENNTYSPVIGEDENDSILSASTDDAVSIRQARLSTSIKAKAVPLVSSRGIDRRPSGLRLTIDSNEDTLPPPAIEEQVSAPASPSVIDPSDVSEAEDYFSIVRDGDLASPSIPAGTPLETATPILYVSPITRPSLISIHSRTPPQLKRIKIPPRSSARPQSIQRASTTGMIETNLRSPQTAINMILQTVPPSSPLAASSSNAADNSVGVPSVIPHHPTDSAPTALSLDSLTSSNPFSTSTSTTLSRSSSFRRLANKASKASLKRQKSKPELPHQHHQADSRDYAPALPDHLSDTATTASSASLSRTASVATTVSSNTTTSTPYTLFPSSLASPNPHHQNHNISTTTLPSQQPQPLASKKSFASLRSLTYTISPVISGSNAQSQSSASTKPRGRFPVVPRVDTSARLPEGVPSSSVEATPESAYGTTPRRLEPDTRVAEDQQRLLATQGKGLGLEMRSGLGKEKGFGGSASLGLRRVMGQVSRSR